MTRIYAKALTGLLFFFCLASAQAGEWKKGKADTLDYLIYLPTDHGAKGDRSLMVNLHGCTQSADTLKQHGNWEGAADEYQMIVVLPQVPNGGKLMGCWDYYGPDHNENNRDNRPLIKLIETLLADTTLHIARNRVFISGLSAGGGESLVVACLRPDLIAGVGLSSSPALGTGMMDLQSPKTTPAHALSLCQKLAGDKKKHFATQLAAIIHSDQDFVVNPEHAKINREMLRSQYGAAQETPLDVNRLPGTRINGQAFLYSNGQNVRLAFIVNNGLGHNWPSGQGGASMQFVAGSSVNYPLFLGAFFHDNALRK